ncbi:MAG: hypothetical protein C5B50_23740 [Verrucomicrobia bacterium]|nr:MAG: hypothetical protein C5B50_23740 [Verrucomicrobiota bacterium]
MRHSGKKRIQLRTGALIERLVRFLFVCAVFWTPSFELLAQTSCAPLPAGIVSWWQSEGNAIDLVGANNGSLVGSVSYGPGIVGQSFVMGGNGSYVQISNSVALQVQSFTIEAWVKRASASNATGGSDFGGNLFGYGTGGYNFGIYNGGQLSLTKTGTSDVQSVALVTNTSFHHLAVTKTGSTVVFYVDGVAYPAAAYDPGFTFSTTPVIGALGTSLGASFWGTIDEMSFYNRALSASEVLSIYTAGSYGKCLLAPRITVQPTNQIVIPGATAYFTVTAASTSPLAYQWQFDGSSLAGATNSSLVITNVSPNQAGTYAVLVSNTNGSVLSSNAVLSLFQTNCTPLASGIVSSWEGDGSAVDVIGGNNGSQVGNVSYGPAMIGQGFVLGGSGSYVQVSNAPALQVQIFTIETWVKRANSTFTTQSGNAGGEIFAYGPGGYALAIYNNGSLSLSKVGVSEVISPVLITDMNIHHLALTKTGSTVVFYVDAVAYPMSAYDPGFTFSTTPAIGATLGFSTGQYNFWGIIDDLAFYNRALSGTEIFSIYAAGYFGKCFPPAAPAITSQPTNETVVAGAAANLAVAAIGFPPPAYQWQFNGNPLAGATNSGLAFPSLSFAQLGAYSVLVSNSMGSVISSNAVLSFVQSNCTTMAYGLVGWWPAELNTADLVLGNTGTLTGNVYYSPGRVNEAFVFSGGNGSYIQLSNTPPLQVQSFTIEAWVQRANSSVSTAGGNSGGVIFAYGPGGYALSIYNDGRLSLSKVGGTEVTTTALLADTTYHHLAVTKTGTTVVFYLDTVAYPVAAYDPGFTFTATPAIGATLGFSPGQYNFWGNIDEVSVYNRALSAGEIQSIYAAGSYGKCYPVPPLFVSQPTNEAVSLGSTAYFSAAAAGIPPVAYQWQFDGASLAGATNSALVIPNVSLGQLGSYSVLVTNSAGVIQSSNAVLSLLQSNCTPLVSGLVGWWQAEGNGLEGIGGINGTPVGSVSYGPGIVNQAFVMGGNGSYVQLANSSALQVQSFTIEAWIQRASASVATAGAGAGGNIFGYGSGGYNLGIVNNGSLSLTKVGSSQVLTSAALITDTNFHHLAVTKTGTNVIFYVDGVAYPVGSYDPGFTFGTIPAIGALGTGQGSSFWGNIDELSFYNRALAASEVQSIYAAGAYGKCAVATAPAVVLQPTNTAVVAGLTASFAAAAAGLPPPAYQWQLNGNPLAGATNSSLVVSNVTLSQLGAYTLLATNSQGSALSSNAVLSFVQSNCAAPPLQGLISWWQAEGNSVDIVSGNNGTPVGSVSYAPGLVNQGFLMGGNGSYIQLPNVPALQVQSFTIEAWVKRASTSLATSGGGTSGNVFGYGTGGYNFGMNNNGALLLTRVGTNGVQTSTLVTDTNFHHLAVTKTGISLVFYVDGVSRFTGSYSAGFTFATTPVIGALGTTVSNSFWGAIDEVSFYNRALSAAEVQSVYSAGSYGKCSSSTAPAIVTQPTNQAVPAGATATFAVSATGLPPPGYQWQFNGNPISGATNSFLAVPNPAANQLGTYSVLVSNLSGFLFSSNAVLSILASNCAPITIQGLAGWWPAEGSKASDIVSGNNGTQVGTVSYGPGMVGQGFVMGGSNSYIQLASSAVLQVQTFTIEAWIKRASTSVATGGTNEGGNIFGYGSGGHNFGIYNDGRLSLTKAGSSDVQTPPLVRDTNFHHLAVTKTGSNVVFYVDGAAYPAPPYSPGFSFGTAPVIGALGTSLGSSFWGTIDEVCFYNRALSTNEVQSIYSAGLNGKCSPIVTLQPTNVTVIAGANASFSVGALGVPPLAYQWQLNGNPLAGATNSSLVVTQVSLGQLGAYAALVTDARGSVLSSNASLALLHTNCTTPGYALASWWSAEGNLSDNVGGNNGTAIGGVSYGTGIVGQGFVMNGNGSYIQLSNAPALQTQTFTIEAWVKRASASVATAGGGAGGNIFGYGTSGYNLGIVNNGSLSLTKVGDSQVQSAALIADTNFHHLAVTKAGSAVIFYVDAVAYPVGAYDPGFTFTTTPVIGALSTNQGASFWGTIDELSIYTRALSAAEVQSVYAAGSYGKCAVPSSPLIVVQPTNAAVAAGASAYFWVGAIGLPLPAYQWEFNGNPLANATKSSLAVPAVSFSQLGTYTVLVTNSNGSVLSSNAVLSFAQSNCAPVLPGMANWWPAEGNAVDVVSGNDGVLVGGISFGPGIRYQGFVCDGITGSYVQLANTTNLQTQTFSIEAWVQRADPSLATRAGTPAGEIFAYGPGGYAFALYNDGHLSLSKVGTSEATTPVLVADTYWHHLAVTKISTNVVFYVDGVAYSGGAYDPGFTFTTTPTIGATLGYGPGYNFWGTIDEVCFYNRALSANEVHSIYAGGMYGKCLPSAAPTIVAQPTNQTVAAGSPGYLIAPATGDPPPAYQWLFNGIPLAGATNYSLVFPSTSLAQLGTYTMLVTNSAGSTLSSNAVIAFLQSNCTPLPSGIMGWWEAEGNAVDPINANNGTLVGGVSYGSGMVFQDFILDGASGSYVQLANTTNLQAQTFTIEAWARRASASLATGSGNTSGEVFAYGPGGYAFAIYNDGHLSLSKVGTSEVITTPLVTDINFHHVAVTKAGTNVIFYVDGVAHPVAAYDPGFTFTTTPAIGATLGLGEGQHNFLGQLDEVSFYNRALSGSEVYSIYAAGSYGKCLPSAAPVIVSQPKNQSIPAGTAASFAVGAAGTPTLAYQWRFDGAPLSAATNSSFVVPNVTLAQLGTYTVLVTNSHGSSLSSNAVLSVQQSNCTPPVVGMVSWWQGEGTAVDIIASNNGVLMGGASYVPGIVGQGFLSDGNNGSFVQISNSPALQIQSFTIETWVKRASASLATASGNPGGLIFGYGPGGYTFGIYNDGRLTLSKVGVSEVTTTALIVNTNFHHLAVTKAGSTVVFFVDGVAYPAAAYDPGFVFTTPPAIAATLGFSPGQYNFWGIIDEVSFYSRALSASEIQSIYAAGSYGKCSLPVRPAIIAQPLNQTVPAGGLASFTVAATGIPAPAYQWLLNGTPVTGATNSSLVLHSVSLSQLGTYTVLLTNSQGSLLSSNALLSFLQTSCTPRPSGMVGWWQGEGNPVDVVGGNNGMLLGGVSFGPAMVYQGFVSDGNSGSYVQLANTPALQVQSFTIEAWVQRASATVSTAGPTGGNIFGYGPGGYNLGMYNDGRLSLTKVNNSEVTTAALVTDTNFHHLAVTKTGTSVVFYVDGVAYPVAAYDPGFTFSSTPTIGAALGAFLGNYNFWGAIDELGFYNRALSASEIYSIYAAGSYGKCLPSASPTFGLQPTDQPVAAGTTVTFESAAMGNPPPAYQWRFNGNPLPGATNYFLIVPNVSLGQVGSYTVLATNSAGSRLSSTALLSILQTTCSAVPSGLVSWWAAEGNATDMAGGNHGTAFGSVSYGPGIVYQGFVLGGSGSYVQLSNSPALQAQTFTIETWVKRASASVATASGTPGANLFGYGPGGWNLGIYNDGRLSFTKAGSSDVQTAALVTDTNYHHLCVTKTGSTVVFYVDGVAYPAPAYDPGFAFSTTPAIGAMGTTGGYNFWGTIDEVSFYNRALSSSEVHSIYAAGSYGKCLSPPSPVFYLQPASQAVALGSTTSFTVAASGSPPPSYQWRFNGSSFAGATGTIFVVPNVSLSQLGSYSVLASNSQGSKLTTNAVLSLLQSNCTPPVSGMVSWWGAEGNAVDLAGSNNGVMVGNVTYGPGLVYQGFVFGGNGSYVQLSNSPALQVQSFTIEAWVKRASASLATASGGVGGNIFGYSTGGYNFGMYNDGRLSLGVTGISDIQTAILVTDTNFHHLAVTKAGSTVLFYVDGAAYSVGAYGPVFGFSTTPVIGALGTDHGDSFWGAIDELAIYNRALSASEVQSMYAAGSYGKCPLPVPPAILVQPSPQFGSSGSAISLAVSASGSMPLGYQWSFNGLPLAGATATSLVLSNAQVSQTGTYSVIVTNAFGMALSSNVLVTVMHPALYDPALAFSAASNPAGVWSYGFSSNLGGVFILFQEELQVSGVDLWRTNISGAAPSAFHNGTTGTVTIYNSIVMPPGALGLHPGINAQYSLARFTAPAAAQYQVLAAFSGLDSNGTTTDVHVLTNRVSIFDGIVSGFGAGTGPTVFLTPILNAGDYLDFAVGVGPDGSYSSDATGLSAQIGINHAPTARNLPLATSQNHPASVTISNLLLYCSDPDSDPLNVSSVTTTSTNGGTVTLSPYAITYTPAASYAGADRFTYTVADGHGGTASAYVLVIVASSNQQSPTMLTPAAISGGFQINFLGFPGYTYSLQKTFSILGPWTTLATITTDGSGLGSYPDLNPPASQAFYRATYP